MLSRFRNSTLSNWRELSFLQRGSSGRTLLGPAKCDLSICADTKQSLSSWNRHQLPSHTQTDPPTSCLTTHAYTLFSSHSSPFPPPHATQSYRTLFLSKCPWAPKNVAFTPKNCSAQANTSSQRDNRQTTNPSSSSSSRFYEFAKRYAVNHFAEPKKSWNEAIDQARAVARYDTDLYQRMMNDYALGRFLDIDKLEENKTLQEFVSHYFRTSSYQITGLITILFTKFFLSSRGFWPSGLGTSQPLSDLESAKLEADLVKLAEVYDMISYGFYFHDTISPLAGQPYETSLRNLLLLLGDYFLVKSSYDVASLSRLNLYKIYVQTVSKASEGESLSLVEQKSDSPPPNTATTYADNPEVEVDPYLNNDHSRSCAVQLPEAFQGDSPAIGRLISYAYLTSGHLMASSMQSAFYLANFSVAAQELAFEFGKNLGMAIKISNQLSASFVLKVTSGEVQLPSGQLQSRQCRPLPVNHLNVSYFAKFPAVSMEAMQYLLAEYTDRSLRLLGSLVEPPGAGCLLDAQADLTAANLAPSINSESPGTVPSQGLSDRSKALMECLVRIVNEIACFNQQNLSRSHGK